MDLNPLSGRFGQNPHLELRSIKSAQLIKALLLTTLSTPIAVEAAIAKRFYCGNASNAPATLATTTSGKTVPVIRWTSTTFNSAGWSQQKRCQVVSERFENYRKQGSLIYLTTGSMNGMPVICTAKKDGGGCDGLLYTLKPGQNPNESLALLINASTIDVKNRPRDPLNETTGRLYIKMSDLLDTVAEINKPTPEEETKTERANQLW